jgi:hypothetical protein
VIFHLWSRAHRPSFREALRGESAAAHAAQRRVATLWVEYLLGSKAEFAPGAEVESLLAAHVVRPAAARDRFGPYGLGRARSLAEYERVSGVCFKTRRIEPWALFGGHAREEFAVQQEQMDAMELVVRQLAVTAATPAANAAAAMPQEEEEKKEAPNGDAYPAASTRLMNGVARTQPDGKRLPASAAALANQDQHALQSAIIGLARAALTAGATSVKKRGDGNPATTAAARPLTTFVATAASATTTSAPASASQSSTDSSLPDDASADFDV